MEILTATIEQMAFLFCLIALGVMLAKVKAIPTGTAAVLGKLENNLLIPALVLYTFATNFTTAKLASAGKLFLLGLGISMVMCVVGWALARLFDKDETVRAAYTYGLAFANFSYMGNAVAAAVFPEFFLDYLIFTLPMWIMIYVWGVPYVLVPRQEGKRTVGSSLKALINPMMICMIVGMVIGLTGWQMPGFLDKTVATVKDCMSPVAMLLTGITVAGMNIKKILSMWSVYVVTFIRLIVIPLVFLGIFMLVPCDRSLVICCTCAMAMPLGLNAVVVPAAYGKDTSVAAGISIISHVISCATIPLIFYFMTNWVL